MIIGIRILAGVIVIAALGCGWLAYMNRPISKKAVNEQINRHLTRVLKQNDSLSSVLLTISSERNGYHEQFAVGTRNRSVDEPARIDSPYHAASVGKTMCAAIYGMLVDKGKISYDETVSSWLEADLLEGLFVIDGIDYRDQVTIQHLLSHTSGLNDYFAGPVKSGKSMVEIITSDPDIPFTPEALITFTRDNQEPVGRPGQQFYYSDTGYVLLGLMLEAIEGKPYSDLLRETIFEPLGMRDSYLFNYEKPAEVLGLYIDGTDYSSKKALSVDWSGGGVVTTMKDLLTFMRALEDGKLLSDEGYGRMTRFVHRYDKGIYYGMGMMKFDFSELSFLLGSMTDVYGAVGATGVYALYDKERDTYFIANFGSLGFAEKSIEELVKIRLIYDRMIVE